MGEEGELRLEICLDQQPFRGWRFQTGVKFGEVWSDRLEVCQGWGHSGKGEVGKGIVPFLGRLSLAAESAWRVLCQLLQLSSFSEPSDTGKAGQGTGAG